MVASKLWWSSRLSWRQLHHLLHHHAHHHLLVVRSSSRLARSSCLYCTVLALCVARSLVAWCVVCGVYLPSHGSKAHNGHAKSRRVGYMKSATQRTRAWSGRFHSGSVRTIVFRLPSFLPSFLPSSLRKCGCQKWWLCSVVWSLWWWRCLALFGVFVCLARLPWCCCW